MVWPMQLSFFTPKNTLQSIFTVCINCMPNRYNWRSSRVRTCTDLLKTIAKYYSFGDTSQQRFLLLLISLWFEFTLSFACPWYPFYITFKNHIRSEKERQLSIVRQGMLKVYIIHIWYFITTTVQTTRQHPCRITY